MAEQNIPPDTVPSDSGGDLHKFVWRTATFVLPVLLVLLPPFAILFLSGEFFREVDHLVPTSSELVVGYQQNDANGRYYKYSRLNSLPRQAVLAVGSSRVLQFREEMFTRPFYNAGFLVMTLRDLLRFVESLPQDKLPEVLLVGLDQWMFHPDWEATMGGITPEQWKKNASYSLQSAIAAVPDTCRDTLRGRISLPAVCEECLNPQFIGLNAIMHRTGFRSDGSYDYGDHVQRLLQGDPQLPDYQFRDTLQRITAGRNRFEWSARISDAAVKDTHQLLQTCRRRGIAVVAFLPPFADKVYEAMQASDRYSYVQQIAPAIRDIFHQHSAELHEFQTMAACGSSDREALDGFHGGEVTYLRILHRMLEQNSRLSSYVAADHIAKDLANHQHRYSVYRKAQIRTASHHSILPAE